MKRIPIVLSILLAASSVLYANEQNPGKPKPFALRVSQTEKQEWENLKKRFIKYSPHMSGLLWALIHTYESKSEMERSLNLMRSISFAIASKNPASLRKFNGPQGFKQKLVKLMSSNDETVSGFAASMLAIIGDQNYAPHIAGLLNRKGDSPLSREVSVRGQAAGALGLLGAKQYAPRIAEMLKSENRYDREGAATALGLLKATDYAKEVADTLSNGSVGSWDDDSAIRSLFEMGVAANYKKEIAEVLKGEILGDSSKTAAYALARLGAKEYAKDIALLLKNNSKKGDAAKALALLGAGEYAAEIVLMLEDKDSFNREDAALALGVLGAKEHAAAVAKLLKAEEVWVSIAAAQALILMESNEYAPEVLESIAKQKSGDYLDAGDFDTLVNEQVGELDNRLKTLLARMKGNLPRP